MSEREFSWYNYRRLIAAGTLLGTTALGACSSSQTTPTETVSAEAPTPTPTSSVSERPIKAPTDDYEVKCTGVEVARTSVPEAVQQRSGMPKLLGFVVRVLYSETGISVTDDDQIGYSVRYASKNENNVYVISTDYPDVKNEKTTGLGVDDEKIVRLEPVVTAILKDGDTTKRYSDVCEEVSLSVQVQ